MKRRNKIFIFILTSAVVLLIGLYLSVFHFGLIEYLANRELKNRIGKNLPLKVRIGDIDGDYLSTLILRDLNVIYDDSIYSYIMASVPKLFLKYSLRNLWRGQLIFDRVFIDSADVTLMKSGEGKWLIPRPMEASRQEKKIVDFEIGKVGLNNLRLTLLMPDDSIVFRNIYLRGRLEGREKTYSAFIEGLNFQSSDTRFNLVASTGKLSLTGNRLVFQDLVAVTDSSEIKLSGLVVIDENVQTSLALNSDRLNLAELSSFIHANLIGNISAEGEMEYKSGELTGQMSIIGDVMKRHFDSLYTSFNWSGDMLNLDTLSGFILRDCRFDGKGNVDFSKRPIEYHLVGVLNHFNVTNLVFGSPSSDFNGRINLTGRGDKPEDLVLDMTVELDESWFDEYHTHKATGSMTITTDSLSFPDRFVLKYHDNTFIASGNIDYDGPVELYGKADFNNLSVFSGQTFIERMGGRGKADFEVNGEFVNPNISGRFVSDSLWLYDILSGDATIDLDIDRFLSDRNGTVDVRLTDGTAYNIPYDTILLKMSLDSQFVFIDSSFLYNEFAGVTAFGTLDYLSYPQRLILNKLSIDILGLPLTNDSLIVVSIDSAGYDFINCRLIRPAGYIQGSGRINYDETMGFEVTGDGIDVVPWVKLYSDEYEISGFISGRASISGNFMAPLINFQGKVDSLRYQDLYMGNLFADFVYSDEKIHLDSISLKSRFGYYNAQGKFPVNLAFTSVENRSPDDSQDIQITAYDTRFDLVSFALYEVEDMTGKFNADVRLHGTPYKPKLDGTVTIRDGRLKLYDLVLPVEDLYVDMKMINETVFIDSLSAVCRNGRKNTGIVRSDGEITVRSIDEYDYNVNVEVKEFPAKYELGDISALVDANLFIRGLTPPTVYGDVNIISVNYRENFASEQEGWIILSSLQSENSWDLNLNVEAKSNLWIKNDDIDAEFAGTLNFLRENGRYRYIGSMEILRGKGYWVDRTFRIEPGGLISYEDIEYPNPRLDIYASTKVRGTVPSQVGDEVETTNLNLRVHITNTLDKPIISAAEESQFSTEEMLTLLLLNTNPADLETTERLTSGLSGFLSSQVGRIGTRTLGVETFEIDPVYGEKFEPMGTQLTLGMYTHPNLYIYGRSAISGETGQRLGFEYRLRRFLMMEGRADEGDLYRLFLNFHWEY